MASRTVKMLECDNPQCSARFPHTKEDPAPGVFIDRGWWDLSGGGSFAKAYACSWDCLEPAVREVAQEAWDNGPRKRW